MKKLLLASSERTPGMLTALVHCNGRDEGIKRFMNHYIHGEVQSQMLVQEMKQYHYDKEINDWFKHRDMSLGKRTMKMDEKQKAKFERIQALRRKYD